MASSWCAARACRRASSFATTRSTTTKTASSLRANSTRRSHACSCSWRSRATTSSRCSAPSTGTELLEGEVELQRAELRGPGVVRSWTAPRATSPTSFWCPAALVSASRPGPACVTRNRRAGPRSDRTCRSSGHCRLRPVEARGDVHRLRDERHAACPRRDRHVEGAPMGGSKRRANPSAKNMKQRPCSHRVAAPAPSLCISLPSPSRLDAERGRVEVRLLLDLAIVALDRRQARETAPAVRDDVRELGGAGWASQFRSARLQHVVPGSLVEQQQQRVE